MGKIEMATQVVKSVRVGSHIVWPNGISGALRRFLFSELKDEKAVDEFMELPGGTDYALELWNPVHVDAVSSMNLYH